MSSKRILRLGLESSLGRLLAVISRYDEFFSSTLNQQLSHGIIFFTLHFVSIRPGVQEIFFPEKLKKFFLLYLCRHSSRSIKGIRNLKIFFQKK